MTNDPKRKNLVDALLSGNIAALPNGAGAVNGAGIDLGNSSRGDFVADCELLIEAPALTTTELPNSETMTYAVYHDTDPEFGTEVLLANSIVVQTGAGGAGAVAKSGRWRPPSDVSRYIRVKATKTGTGNVSGKSASVKVTF